MQQEMLKETMEFLASKNIQQRSIGIVLGTGLNSLVNEIEIEQSIPYTEIPHFPASTVSFHKGALIIGQISGVKVVAMQGRFHYYEGYSMQQITYPIRVMHEMGIRTLLLSNAAGGINPSFKKGDLILTDDHINLLPDNPLRGIGDEMGNRFVDMSSPYDVKLQAMLASIFKEEKLQMKKGVYASVMGPNLETRAEYRWLKNMGADMVGMSTVPEVIVANQVGIACAAISVITDECDPDHLQPVNIAEILEVAARADQVLTKVILKFIAQLT